MLVTNTTTADYWFGPLHLPAGNGQTLTVDDTSATSLYLTNDAVADSINTLYQSGKILVSGANPPFPRATSSPEVLHGDGSPEGLVYAAQGSVYLRRDRMAIFQKNTGVHFNNGWVQIDDDDDVSPSAALFETFPRENADANLSVLATGTLVLQAVFLPYNAVVSSITCVSGATAAGTPTNQWFALYDQNLNKLAVTADDTATAWATDSAKTLSISGGFTTTYAGLHYLGLMVKATTVPTLAGQATRASITGLAPKTCGPSTGGLTNPASAPAAAAAITAAAASIYAYTS
jgi:hypothetical protein